jgi:OOP family OmpA-OmpF porin
MKKAFETAGRRSALAIAFGMAAAIASPVYAQVKDIVVDPKKAGVFPYVLDPRGVVARSGTGLCWRTGYWTPQLAAQFPEAGCACDRDLLPKEVCEPPAPKAEASAPAPAAAPIPAPAPAPAAPKVITLSAKSLFGFNQAVLTPGGKETIDKEVVSRLGEFGKINAVIVSGHTDRLGSAQYNQKLSERRAEAVKAYLIGKSVSPDVIETFGYGKTQPVPEVKCDDKLKRKQLIECLAPNRRVVVEVKGDPK